MNKKETTNETAPTATAAQAKANNRAIQAEARRVARAAKLVAEFVSTDAMRKNLMTPYHDKKNGVVVATNGAVLIATKHGFNPGAEDRDYPRWQQVIPDYHGKVFKVRESQLVKAENGDYMRKVVEVKYPVSTIPVVPSKVAAACRKCVGLAKASFRNGAFAALPLVDGKQIVLDAGLLLKVADAMDANGITEIKAAAPERPIVAKNGDAILVAMPVRDAEVFGGGCAGRNKECGGLLIDAQTGRMLAAPERLTAKKLEEFKCNGIKIEKAMAAEDEIDALMDAKPAKVEEKPAPAAPAAPEAVEPSPYADHLTEWRKLTHDNEHTGVRLAISKWCEANAKSERDEFASIADDFAYILSTTDGDTMTPELCDFRMDLTDELMQRIGRVFGKEAHAAIMGTL